MKIIKIYELFGTSSHVDNSEIVDILLYRDFEDLIDIGSISYRGVLILGF